MGNGKKGIEVRKKGIKSKEKSELRSGQEDAKSPREHEVLEFNYKVICMAVLGVKTFRQVRRYHLNMDSFGKPLDGARLYQPLDFILAQV
jgi:hypothetical protein